MIIGYCIQSYLLIHSSYMRRMRRNIPRSRIKSSVKEMTISFEEFFLRFLLNGMHQNNTKYDC